MLKILHRINTLEQLSSSNPEFGVEIDIHGYGDKLVVHHDALTNGTDLDEWLLAYRHRFVIFNIKEEGIEEAVRQAAEDAGVKDYFLLDLSFPALIKMVRKGEHRLAVRVSKYEPVAGALSLSGYVSWVWLDVFDGWPLTLADYECLSRANFKICLVSPELHGGYRGEFEIYEMQELMKASSFTVDAVCTKYPDLWDK
jgi:hypothetical protein